MRYTFLMISFLIAFAITAVAGNLACYKIPPQEKLPQPQDTQMTDQFIKRLKDEKFIDIQGGAMWTLIHDYKDYKHIQSVLTTLQRYMEALAKYEQGDNSSLNKLGGIKQLKNQLAIWLDDNDQAVRAFAATMLGVCGDNAYSRQLAKLLVRTEQNYDDEVYDRGRAALALGLIQSKEYGKDLVTMLSSANEYDRYGAAEGLGWMGDKENAKAVARLLTDKDERVREIAKWALEMLGASELMKDKR